MSKIIIKNLILQARHGVLDQERRVGNTFRISISLDVPSAERAKTSDALADTLNYAEVVQIVRTVMLHPKKLLEAVAGEIISSLSARYGSQIAGGEITVEKLAPPISAQLESVAFSTKWLNSSDCE